MLLSGHDHLDQYHEQAWTGGGGTTVFPNATSLSIQKDGDNDFYPGFKMPEFSGGGLVSHSYKLIGGVHYSYPYYHNCNVGGTTDLSTLDQTSVVRTFSNGGDWSGDLTNVYCDVENRLDKEFNDCGLEFYMPDPGPNGYYAVSGGQPVSVSQPESGRLNYRVDFDLPAYSTRRVSLDLETDSDTPTGSVTINGGASQTASLDVTLGLSATDASSGVKEMMVSNRADFAGAEWEPYATSRAWRLEEGSEGYRSVYARYRDYSYPGHVSYPASDTIVYNTGSEPWKDRWYFAEGYTGAGFEEYLCILNPSSAPTHATLTYMPEGAANIVREIDIPGMSRYTVNVNNDAGGGLNVSCLLEADSEVVAERAMYFAYGGLWTGGHCVMGAKSAEETLYFAEGYTGPGFEEWLTVQNPGDSAADVTLTYMMSNGNNHQVSHTVPAHSRYTVMVNRDCPEAGDVSIRLESTQPVIAERPMYFEYGGLWTGGHCVMGARSAEETLYFAEGYTGPGFEEWLTVQNPGDSAADVTLTYMMSNGNNHQVSHTVPAHSRYTVMVNRDCPEAGDVSIRLESSQPVIAERPMYFNYRGAWTGGHCVMGAEAVDLNWYLAEGYTGPGFEEWITILNPDPGPAGVEVTLVYILKGSGATVTRKHTLQPSSRYTIFVNQDLGEGQEASAMVISKTPVLVERPMYFDQHGWTGGHCVPAFSKR